MKITEAIVEMLVQVAAEVVVASLLSFASIIEVIII